MNVRSLYSLFFVLAVTNCLVLPPVQGQGQGRDWDAPYSTDKYVWHVTGRKSQGQYIPADEYQVGTRQMVVGENIVSQGGAAFGDLNMDISEYVYTDWVGGPYHTKGDLCRDCASHLAEEWMIKIGCRQQELERPHGRAPLDKNWIYGLLVLGGIIWLFIKLASDEKQGPPGIQVAEAASDMPTQPLATGKYVPETIDTQDRSKLKDLELTPEQLLQIKREINLHGQDPLSALVKEMKENRVLGMGEVHAGDAGNPFRDFGAQAISQLAKAGATHLAVEVPVGQQKGLDKLIKTGNADTSDLPALILDDNYKRLISSAHKAGLQIKAVDGGDVETHVRNRMMSENISQILESDSRAKVIFWVGAIHIKNTKKPEETSVTYRLNEKYPGKVVSVFADMKWMDISSGLRQAGKAAKKPICISPFQATTVGDLKAGGTGYRMRDWNLIILFPPK